MTFRDAFQLLSLRFYGRLNDFLRRKDRGRILAVEVKGRPALIDTIQALGVPHPETGEILRGSCPVSLSYRPAGPENFEVYPREFLMTGPPSFLLDVHLGKLARLLRLLGFDCLYRNDYTDPQIVSLAGRGSRVVLTRDIGLLKHRRIRFGYWLRETDPEKQAAEILRLFPVFPQSESFRRCLACNGLLKHVGKEEVRFRLPEKTRRSSMKEFYRCQNCRKVYWPGTHYPALLDKVRRLTHAG